MLPTNLKPISRDENERSAKKQRAQGVRRDIARIDSALEDSPFSVLKHLHVELDGTYQPVIKSWGMSMYGFIEGYGFNYEYLDESSIRDNLLTMKGKLRGFMLQLDPTIIDTASGNKDTKKSGDKLARDERQGKQMRLNMYDIITKNEFKVSIEYERIWKLFNTNEYWDETPLYKLVDGGLQFFPIRFRRRALSLVDFNNSYGFAFKAPHENVTIDELVAYCEYVITLCDHLWEYASFTTDTYSVELRDDLYQTVEDCMDEHGLVAAKRDHITIYVNKAPEVVAAAELVDESLSYDVKAYIHNQAKGDLARKKAILKLLADEIEPKRKVMEANNLKGLADQLFQMLQKFIRHNNDDNPLINSLSPEELEKCYDDIYQLWILATLEIENIDRKRRLKELLGKINTPIA